jgi:hypothetical protein
MRIRIRDPVSFIPLDPGWVKLKIRIGDEHPGSYFRELSLIFDQGSRMKKIRIRDPG